MEQTHHHWLTEQRSKAIPEEEPTASAFAVEKLREMLEDGMWNVDEIPERALQRAALDVEKKAAAISEKHSGRAAMRRVLGKTFFVDRVPDHAFAPEPTSEKPAVHHPESDHARRRSYG